MVCCYPGNIVVGSKLFHDSRNSGYRGTLTNVNDALIKVAHDWPGLGEVMEVETLRNCSQTVFCKMDPYMIDRRILEELQIDYNNYLYQFGSRKGPKLPRIVNS